MNQIFVILILAFFFNPLFAQIDDVDEYNLLLSEAHILSNYQSKSEITNALADSARYYADQGDYTVATIFLEELIQNAIPGKRADFTLAQVAIPKIQFEIGSGIDFNKQEFELGFTESDSLLSDEVRNPFVMLDAMAQLSGLTENGVQLRSNFRYDKENTSFTTTLKKTYFSQKTQFWVDAGFMYDHNETYPEFSYTEINSRQYVYIKMNPDWNLRVNNSIRYKNYKNPSSTIPNFLNDEITLDLQNSGRKRRLHTFSYRANLNESLGFDNNDYLDQTLIYTGIGSPLNRTVYSYSLSYSNTQFNYSLGDSSISNRSQSVESGLDFDVALVKPVHWITEFAGILKYYSKMTEQDPSYQHYQIMNKLRFKPFDDFFWEAGHRFEFKNHFLFKGAQDEYIEEQNYTGNGAITGLDYNIGFKFLLSLELSYTWRRYPEANPDIWGSAYNNRNVFNLNFIIQAPLTSNISFNTFVSYDNDQDLDSDAGNTRSSIFSAEIRYKF